jgi:hypothetical protein
MEHKLQMSTEDIKEDVRNLVQRFDRIETKLDQRSHHRFEKVENLALTTAGVW